MVTWKREKMFSASKGSSAVVSARAARGSSDLESLGPCSSLVDSSHVRIVWFACVCAFRFRAAKLLPVTLPSQFLLLRLSPFSCIPTYNFGQVASNVLWRLPQVADFSSCSIRFMCVCACTYRYSSLRTYRCCCCKHGRKSAPAEVVAGAPLGKIATSVRRGGVRVCACG